MDSVVVVRAAAKAALGEQRRCLPRARPRPVGQLVGCDNCDRAYVLKSASSVVGRVSTFGVRVNTAAAA